MQVLEGKAATWMVAAVSGRCIGAYEGEGAEAAARAHVERSAGRGVRLRLFFRESCTVECEHP
jgi:hypothetical protein